jgi:hypothetical protein
MRRKVPSSTKQKRRKLQAARQEARTGKDVHAFPASNSAANTSTKPKGQPKSRRPKFAARVLSPEEAARQKARNKASSLESRFLKLPKDLVQHLRLAASEHRLPRPIDGSLSFWPIHADESLGLSCPKRPKWHYTSTKNEVEKVGTLLLSLLSTSVNRLH